MLSHEYFITSHDLHINYYCKTIRNDSDIDKYL
jgi:hypothetical protein